VFLEKSFQRTLIVSVCLNFTRTTYEQEQEQEQGLTRRNSRNSFRTLLHLLPSGEERAKCVMPIPSSVVLLAEARAICVRKNRMCTTYSQSLRKFFLRIYSQLPNPSVISYWENFSVHAFENTTQNFFQTTLLEKGGSDKETVQCSACFTIRRDVSRCLFGSGLVVCQRSSPPSGRSIGRSRCNIKKAQERKDLVSPLHTVLPCLTSPRLISFHIHLSRRYRNDCDPVWSDTCYRRNSLHRESGYRS
jgi:hypothetical protein